MTLTFEVTVDTLDESEIPSALIDEMEGRMYELCSKLEGLDHEYFIGAETRVNGKKR